MTDEGIPTARGKRRRGLNAVSAEPRHILGHVAALRASALLATAFAVALVGPVRAQENDRRIEALERQNEVLARQNEALQRQMEVLLQDMQAVKQRLPLALPPPEAQLTLPLPAGPAVLPGPVTADGEPLVTRGEERVKLTVSGFVHRALNLVDDGDRTKVYNVDPVAANSRFRFVGSAQVTDDVELGAAIEIGVAPNSSERVSQDDEDVGDKFDQRVTEMTVDSKRFGKLSLGKGSTASDNTAQVDLSGTNIVLYSSTGQPVSGLKFREKGGSKDLTDVRIRDAFNNFDGLGREERVQYDSPTFAGFTFGTTYASDQRADATVRWSSEIGDFKAAAAGAVFDPNKDDVDIGLDGSASVLHKGTGLNLTLAAGMEKTDDGGNRSQLYIKGGWIANFFDFGSSHFAIDAATLANLPTSSDESWTVGAAYVQRVEDYGVELYAKVSVYDLDRDNDPSVDQIMQFTVGSRVKF